MTFFRKVLPSCLALLLLTGCGGSENATENLVKPSPAEISFAEDAVPQNAELKDIYSRSCQSCHALYGMNAPLTGHKAGWQPRLESKGIDGLVATTKSGFRGMPAMGLCQDCSDENFAALIQFMAGETN